MSADRPAAASLSLPALPRPLSLTPLRARHLDLSQLGGPPGQADHAVLAALSGPGVSEADPRGLVVHEITTEGHRVRGVVGLLGVASSGTGQESPTNARSRAALLPHEGAIAERATRLAARMSELAVDPAPMLLLHRPTQPGQVRFVNVLDALITTSPDRDGVDARQRRHRWWIVTDEQRIETVARAVARGQLLIADGHHRYAAHLQLAARRPREGDARALVMITDAERDAPMLSPIHRVLRRTSLADVVRRLGEAGHQVGSDRIRPGVPGDARAHDPDLVLVDDGSKVLPVRIVGRAGTTVVERVHRALGDADDPSRWSTHHEAVQARAEAGRAPDGVALIMPAPTTDEVWAAAIQGRLLPAKATSFIPKPPLGLVFRSWRDG